MGTKKLLEHKGFLYESMGRTMVGFLGSFWALLCKYLLCAFGFITRYTFRYHGGENYQKIDSDCSVVHRRDDDQPGPNVFDESEVDGFGEEENSEFGLGLKSSAIEDSNKSCGETESSVFMETASTASTNKYRFMSGNDICGFMEEPKHLSFRFTIHEVGLDSNEDSYSKSTILDSNDKVFQEHNLEAENVNQEKTEDPAEIINSVEVLEREEEEETFRGFQLIEKGEIAGLENDSLNKHDLSDKIQSENPLFCPKLETLPTSSEDEMLIEIDKIDSTDDEISPCLSTGKGTDRETFMATDEIKVELREESPCTSENHSSETTIADKEVVSEDEVSPGSNTANGTETETFMATDENTVESRDESPYLTENHSSETIIVDEEVGSDDDFIELEPHSFDFYDGFLFEHDFEKFEDEHESKGLVHEESKPMDTTEKSQEPSLEEEEEVSSISDSDDEIGFEVLHEHEDYIKQLKLELKHVKNRGLPTILEDSESPKMAEDLKPLKIDKKMEHKDRVEEIQKFYKSYAEKMRKLDILNNQTMHAIGLLKLKGPAQLNSTKKSSVPALKSLISQKFRQSKVRNHEDKPTKKFINELQRDFELVYIGQLCLSWEILHWQRRKSQELQDYDPDHSFRQYNHVAGLYQQFQVLLQRFIEDEPFQERPRIQNYVENRCVLPGFLQVPAIKEDCKKEKKPKQEGEYVISVGMLTEIIGESMRVFWEFLRADKDDANVTSRGLHAAHLHLDEPADLELLMDLQTNYQKKEKKLKEVLRSKTCIVKRFQKNQEDQLNRAMFDAQIELKLVAKVLNMSRLTRDQLVWCHKKLKEINFVSRNICIEPSFLLFPC